jgi:Ca2+-binding RTX toxin-like protein
MYRPNPAGKRGRPRRALLAAALPAVLAAIALPSAANAAFVGDGVRSTGDHVVSVLDRSITGGSTENNDVTVRVEGNSLVIRDSAGITIGSGGDCIRVTTGEAHCPRSVRDIQINLAGGNDDVEYRAPQGGFVELGAGGDGVTAGRREASGLRIEPVTYRGGSEDDTINYAGADRGVRLTPEDGLANDGRLGDKENVSPDFEAFLGSFFSDAPFFGTPRNDEIYGLGGDDQLAGGGGNDNFVAFEGDGADDYRGGDGPLDRITYESQDQPLIVDIDGVADDGQTGERDNVHGDVETVVGGSAADVLVGSSGADRLIGGLGDDRLDGLTGNDLFIMEDVADGADRITGGPGFDTVHYGKRTRPINATLNHNGADDGEAGEGDELIGANEQIVGGSAGDTITAPKGSKAAHEFHGGAGRDTLFGADGPDILVGDRDPDTFAAFGGGDTIFAKDGESDTVGCGSGPDIDTAHLDPDDVDGGCENVKVGVLRLTPKTVRAGVDEPARMRLSWRHPDGWKRLRTIRLRLRDGLVPVGEITIHARAGRISGDDAVKVARKQTRLTRKGKTVTARLALRLDESLAGQTLKAEVEATDRRGRRQLERNAATVRVAR